VRRSEHAGVSRSVGMKLTGHKTESVYRRYAIVSKGDLEDATRRLDEFAAKITPSADGTVNSMSRKWGSNICPSPLPGAVPGDKADRGRARRPDRMWPRSPPHSQMGGSRNAGSQLLLESLHLNKPALLNLSALREMRLVNGRRLTCR
jgi:hypothetical protein